MWIIFPREDELLVGSKNKLTFKNEIFCYKEVKSLEKVVKVVNCKVLGLKLNQTAIYILYWLFLLVGTL